MFAIDDAAAGVPQERDPRGLWRLLLRADGHRGGCEGLESETDAQDVAASGPKVAVSTEETPGVGGHQQNAEARP